MEKKYGVVILWYFYRICNSFFKEAILAIDEPYEKAVAKLEAAGVEANLMLLKGELVLSGIDNTEGAIK